MTDAKITTGNTVSLFAETTKHTTALTHDTFRPWADSKYI